MIRSELSKNIFIALSEIYQEGQFSLSLLQPPTVLDTKKPEHGDYSCNYAMIHAKELKLKPLELAHLICEKLRSNPIFEQVEIARPGFINLKLTANYFTEFLKEVIYKKESFLQGPFKDIKINIEYVSVNPNGPITVGSGRNAAYGDALARVLACAGFDVHKEFYINDGINSEQMRLFTESVKYYVLQEAGQKSEFPQEGYKGEYVHKVALKIIHEYGLESYKKNTEWFQQIAQAKMIECQREDLTAFRVNFDTWFSEQSLHDQGKVDECIKEIESKGKTYQKEGALWLKTTDYNDDKDRVIVREDGRPTYIASDVAYARDKYRRGFDKLIYVLGPDHHGYIGRLKAAILLLGYPEESLEIALYQMVRFVKDGQSAPMRKRDGNIYELKDLIEEVGVDTARFFFLMRSHDSHLDFDIDLAKKRSDDNPIFYVQYAHARICSILKKAKTEHGLCFEKSNLLFLTHPKEKELIKKILDAPLEVEKSAEDKGVHRLANSAIELARNFHGFYDQCRVIDTNNKDLSEARLALCEATRITLKGLLDLLGIHSPETM